jgi:hypothetical protein
MKYMLAQIILSCNNTGCLAFKIYHAVTCHLIFSRSLWLSYNLWWSRWCTVGRDSSVAKARRYGLHRPGIEFRWGWDFPHPPRQALGLTQPPVQWVPGLFPGTKRQGRGVDHAPLSSAEVKEGLELYLNSPHWTSMAGCKLNFCLWYTHLSAA